MPSHLTCCQQDSRPAEPLTVQPSMLRPPGKGVAAVALPSSMFNFANGGFAANSNNSLAAGGLTTMINYPYSTGGFGVPHSMLASNPTTANPAADDIDIPAWTGNVAPPSAPYVSDELTPTVPADPLAPESILAERALDLVLPKDLIGLVCEYISPDLQYYFILLHLKADRTDPPEAFPLVEMQGSAEAIRSALRWALLFVPGEEGFTYQRGLNYAPTRKQEYDEDDRGDPASSSSAAPPFKPVYLSYPIEEEIRNMILVHVYHRFEPYLSEVHEWALELSQVQDRRPLYDRAMERMASWLRVNSQLPLPTRLSHGLDRYGRSGSIRQRLSDAVACYDRVTHCSLDSIVRAYVAAESLRIADESDGNGTNGDSCWHRLVRIEPRSMAAQLRRDWH